MPNFSYKAFDAAGEMRSGNCDAVSAIEVEQRFAQSGFTVYEVIENGRKQFHSPSSNLRNQNHVRWWQREIGKTRKPKIIILAQFVNELSMLTSAGVSIDQALLLLVENSSSGFQRHTADLLRTQILEGGALSASMRSQPNIFSDELVAIIRAAETSADLSGGLGRMAALLNRRAQLQSEFRSALLYPAVLLAAAIGVLLVVINVLIPNIRPLFDEARAPMPVFIKFLDDAQSLVADNWPLLLLLFTSLLLGILYSMRQPALVTKMHNLALNLPWLSTIIRRQEGARFTRALGAQLISGVSMLSALFVARDALQNNEVKRRVSLAIERIRDGVQPSNALKETDPFPSLTYQLIAVGESSGRLGSVLLQLADTFEQSQQLAIKRAMSLLTPLMTLGIGLLVGLLMLSLMNAITGLNEFALR